MSIKLSPLQKLILRNSGLVPISDIANYLGVAESQVMAWAEELGLPDMEVIDRERSLPIIFRRNHDLLPEEEIAKLMRMPLDACRKLAQEMDFLDIKLGKRPDVFPTIDRQPGPQGKLSTESFRSVCGEYFQNYLEWDRPFGFLEEFNQVEDQFEAPSDNCFRLRMMYSYIGSHGDFLSTGEDFYNDGILSRLRNRGVNAGWMPGLLRDLAPGGIFPEFGEGHEIRIKNLRKQVRKAAEYGIGIYLYLNEPRLMPESFFDKYPNARGMEAQQPGYYGMCTSDDDVRSWLFESMKFVLAEVADLAGIILITASENQTNCYSWSGGKEEGLCPRCVSRGAGRVLADTANIFQSAIEESGSNAEIIQWLWGWDFVLSADGIVDAISCLPKQVTVMVDWAKYTPFTIVGKSAEIGEYTLAYTKPSEFSRKILNGAKMHGVKVLSKCALVSTVEMNAVPYLPVMRNVESLLKELRDGGVDGLMGCWIFGSYPGRNMEMLAHAGDDEPARSLAVKYYGSGAEFALKAWDKFSDGMKYYPSVVEILYYSAINPGPGLRFSLEPEPWRYGMVAMATEDIDRISQPLGSEAMIKGFKETAKHFAEGLGFLRRAVEESDVDHWREENERDYGICSACLCHLRSAANYSEFILTRNRWIDSGKNNQLASEVARIMRDELENSETMLNLAKRDSRIGYEGAIGYFYTPIEVIEKIYGLKADIDELNRITQA